ncbi:Imm17 family immunity protein [Myroides fluvii]|uniref:Imm17 family immunity protein n=1 Tax=Myroides fluvii TaxID=2572594 RepID=UPI00131A6E1D
MNIDEIFDHIKNNPKLAYMTVGLIFTLILIGYIKRWKWATDPTGNRKSRILVEYFGYENYRKIMIVILILGILAISSIYLLST